MKLNLCVENRKNDLLSYILLMIGNCEKDKTDTVYRILLRYAEKGANMESASSDALAEAIASFYSTEQKSNATSLPNYLGVFKEFTTAGFHEVLRLLLSAVKPTAEDYNWLVAFFDEVVEFYYNPARLAYVNLLLENPELKLRLEQYKKSQEQQVKKEGAQLEVTFNIPTANLQKYTSMPPHLQAVMTKLILEPLKFINEELHRFFWTPITSH
jgi:hypothetical protein